MPGRKYIGPHLFLKRDRHLAPRWIIIDYGRQRSTGFGEHEKAKAERALREYVKAMPAGSKRPPLLKYHRKTRASGRIYFISSNDVPNFPIKVGFTTKDPSIRLSTLQGGCPYKLCVIGSIRGSASTEAELLKRFGADRLSGEWVARSSQLHEYVNTLVERNALQ